MSRAVLDEKEKEKERKENTPTDLAVVAAVNLLQKGKPTHKRLVLCSVCRGVRQWDEACPHCGEPVF